MRRFLLLSLLTTLLILPACQSGEDANDNEQEQEVTFDPAIIQGTWEMTENMPADTNITLPVDYHQYKIYTKDHVFFLAFHPDSNSVGMMGGGTYTINQDSFTENLTFMSMHEEGNPTSYSFTHKIDATTFAQSGRMESNVEGEEDFMLEERYRRVESSIGDGVEGHPYIGLWKLEKTLYGDGELETQADSIHSLKVITPGHFYIMSSNKNHPEKVNVVFGSQKMEDGKYVETVIANSWSDEMNGQTIAFSAEGAPSTFIMKGVMSYEGNDNYKIEEHYSRVE